MCTYWLETVTMPSINYYYHCHSQYYYCYTTTITSTVLPTCNVGDFRFEVVNVSDIDVEMRLWLSAHQPSMHRVIRQTAATVHCNITSNMASNITKIINKNV